MAFALNIGKCSLLGNYRENNEDSIEVKQYPDLTVCIVADGMGGQAAGEIASKRAIEIVPRELKPRELVEDLSFMRAPIIADALSRSNCDAGENYEATT